MPKPRSIKSTLFQVLNEALLPIYILDCEGKIVFANIALCAWLNVKFESIEMAPCMPSLDVLECELDNLLRGLAIPDSAYRHEHSTGTVFRTAADQHLIWRHANFTRLSGSGDLLGNIQVTLASDDFDLAPEQPTSVIWSRQLIAQVRDHQTQRLGLDRFVGTSPQSVRLNQQIKIATQTQSNLLIEGPPGSGLEDLAETLHAERFPDDSRPHLTCINCSLADAQTIQQTILQVRQSSDGAGDWYRLDYPEQLSHAAANELMGFLQLPRHGMKFISLSNHTSQILPHLKNQIDTLTIKVPPLSDRKEDIPLAAALLLKQKTNNPQIEFDEASQQQLIDYDWPNNLMELEQTISEIDVAKEAEQVISGDFPDRFRQALQAQQIGGSDVAEIQLDKYLATIEAELIGRALQQAKNNKAKASKRLGISRAKLGRRIQQLGLAEQADPIVFEESPEDE